VPTVLVIEDERDMLALLDSNLRAAGFETLLADSGERALAQLRAHVPDLVLLDLMLPDVPGAEVCRQIRADARTRAVPVVICSARGEEIDRVVGFELGADDYVTKPFSMRELVLRLRAVLRRMAGAAAAERPPDRVGPLQIDVDAHRCSIEGVEIELTPIEFRLLVTLTARLGRVQPRERLLADVWGNAPDLETRTLDTHVKRLREKLGPARELLETVRGVGYRFADPDRRG
jgi:two-component system, OmpR family, phosphate regulon response regulator PhoB